MSLLRRHEQQKSPDPLSLVASSNGRRQLSAIGLAGPQSVVSRLPAKPQLAKRDRSRKAARRHLRPVTRQER